ncbi:hypothetical protein [Phaeodactylibacter luteus]|nr:hypothetical protein [Phaeodactylibacter luteus]
MGYFKAKVFSLGEKKGHFLEKILDTKAKRAVEVSSNRPFGIATGLF